MYGHIHLCIRDLVEKRFGEDAWKNVLEKADMNDTILLFHRYDDEETYKLIGAVCEVLDIDLHTVLMVFGEYFFQYCLLHGYDKMLKTLGADFKSFVENLDSLHSLLTLTYKDLVAPSFRCDSNEDGSLLLHYYSVRKGLYPIVLGLVKAIARDLYNQAAEITVQEQTEEPLTGGKTQTHVVFRVVLTGTNETVTLATVTPSFPSKILISTKQFCNAFPYHLVFDSDLNIQQSGLMIQRILGHDNCSTKTMSELFESIHPRMSMTVHNIRMFINTVFLLKCKINMNVVNGQTNCVTGQTNCVTGQTNGVNGQTNGDIKGADGKGHSLILRGQMIWLEDSNHVIFVSSPRLSSLTELMSMSVYLADIPLYDVTRELVLLNQQRTAEIDITKRLDETTNELRQTSKALEEEKKLTEKLLYQMLPENVANELKNGRPVAAEKFEQVTILFSDIVTFTDIAAACQAIQIVKMLNDLYNLFDASTTVHGVYKVETIGDAYMIVSGVPNRTPTHAEHVADFAMDMIQDAASVKSPATGKPLQIRVGMHTGPVVAGVVGQKMPRYCLFGDTVNTASRMESHGMPGRIHVSPTSFKNLDVTGSYIFRKRGEIEVKGKGQMTTYFLIGSQSKQVYEPDDQYNELAVIGENGKSIENNKNGDTKDKGEEDIKNGHQEDFKNGDTKDNSNGEADTKNGHNKEDLDNKQPPVEASQVTLLKPPHKSSLCGII